MLTDFTHKSTDVSTVKSSPRKRHHVEVMVRAFGDEPVRLMASHLSRGRVEVFGTDSRLSLRYPARYVFRFQPARFEALRCAFENQETAHLLKLWGEMAPIEVI